MMSKGAIVEETIAIVTRPEEIDPDKILEKIVERAKTRRKIAIVIKYLN